jgi:cardiolipin synthase
MIRIPVHIVSFLVENRAMVGVVLHLALSFITTLHILYDKRHNPSIMGWLGITWLSPFIGAAIYWAVGINRIHRSQLVRNRPLRPDLPSPLPSHPTLLDRYIANITHTASTAQNKIQVMLHPQQTFDHMLQAIGQAQYSVTLCTYIFDMDHVGHRFVDALYKAKQRGVSVRILVDAIGAQYSKTSSLKVLEEKGIPARAFLPSLWPWKAPYFNLRNHRKIMVVDGQLGFVGGTNIRADHLEDKAHHPTMQDLHFQVEGPAVNDLQAIFRDDWFFTTKEKLQGKVWFNAQPTQSKVRLHVIEDGPDENYDRLRSVYLAAIARAQKCIRIVTPYFVPDETIMEALIIAAKSNVQVQIVVPSKNNLMMVQWASQVPLTDLHIQGCEIYESDPPFDHSKLFLVDDQDSFIGSANWDARSFVLNFECAIHCKDADFSKHMHALVDQKIRKSQRFESPYSSFRYSPKRLRDLSAHLIKGYL